MESQKTKCSSNKHQNIDAISYCQQCKLYLCNKCLNNHYEFYDNHPLINLKDEIISIDECKKEKHERNKFKFFCKNHNILCCSYCISKIKNEFFGQHSDCDICELNDIKGEKIKKLKENINILENLSQNFEKSINDLKIIGEKINENKEKSKIKIQNIFSKLRNALNEKEDQLLLKIDEKYDNLFINQDIIKEGEKLPYKIKLYLQKGKIIEKEYNKINNLAGLINDCIYLENNMNKMNKIKEIIKKLNSKDNNLEFNCNLEEYIINNILEQIKNIDISFNDFNINLEKPICTLKNHSNFVVCLNSLKDGRLVSCSWDKSIIIYNKKSYKPDLIIKAHKDYVLCIITLSSGLLASSSCDSTIKIFNIKENNYKVIQTLNEHKNGILKIIELTNKTLVSCSHDCSIIFYAKDNLGYRKDLQLNTEGSCITVIQTKENEICYSEKNNNRINFYDILERKIKFSLDDIGGFREYNENFIMIKNYLLAIPGENKITLINVNEYKIIRIVDVPNSGWINGICLFHNILFTGDDSNTIRQWEIKDDNLILVLKREEAHNSPIITLTNMGNGHMASGSLDNSIKIWQILEKN